MSTASGKVSGLAATGSLVPATGSAPGRAWLMVEASLLFVGVPLAMDYVIHTYRVSLILMLQPILIGLILFLLWDRTFSLKRELARGFPLSELKWIAGLLAVTGLAATAWIYLSQNQFLTMPATRPRLWLIILVFYPLLSAFPQELVYRTFFFHRYGHLFGGRRWLAIGVNGALFGFAHVMFGSVISVVLSGALGLLLAYRYTQTRSIWAVWVEHSLYGQMVFTVGLGHYFFTGVSVIPHG